MAGDLIRLETEGGTVEVRGLRSTFKDLERMGADVAELRGVMEAVGGMVADTARGLARRVSGTMAGSIRPGKAKSRAVIRAGGARVPYAGVQHYGWTKRNISPNPFLTDALASKQNDVLAKLDEGLSSIINKK